MVDSNLSWVGATASLRCGWLQLPLMSGGFAEKWGRRLYLRFLRGYVVILKVIRYLDTGSMSFAASDSHVDIRPR